MFISIQRLGKYTHKLTTGKAEKMNREHAGMYTEVMRCLIEGEMKEGKFRVWKVENAPFWFFDCPSLRIAPNGPFEKKEKAMEHMYLLCKMGMRRLSGMSAMIPDIEVVKS